ncbi:hypothetical protein LPJ79_005485 [Coemansia sp. RSA 1821]|nr:hypothetical protein LPJ79_005485 [Coemansia sp. RSA 1821]
MNSNHPLPPQFYSVQDKNGRQYFVDRITGRSQWEDPRMSMGSYSSNGPQPSMALPYQYQQQSPASYGYQPSSNSYGQWSGPPPNSYYPNQQPNGYYSNPPPNSYQGPPNYYQGPPPQQYYPQQQPPQHVVVSGAPPKKESFFKKHSMLTGLAAGGLAAFGVNEFMEHEQEERFEAFQAGQEVGYNDGYEDGFDDGGDF